MDVIRELRVVSGLTQKEFSDILGVSQQAVSKWENNTAEPDIQTLIKIAQYFEVSVDELLGLDSQKAIKKPEPKEKDSVIKDNTIAFTLKMLRKEKHLTQKQLAIETGLSLSSIISYENGLRKPNSKAMVTLESFFGVSGEYLCKQPSQPVDDTFTENLKRIDPIDKYKGTVLEGLDPFSRQIKRFEIEVSGKASVVIKNHLKNSTLCVKIEEESDNE